MNLILQTKPDFYFYCHKLVSIISVYQETIKVNNFVKLICALQSNYCYHNQVFKT